MPRRLGMDEDAQNRKRGRTAILGKEICLDLNESREGIWSVFNFVWQDVVKWQQFSIGELFSQRPVAQQPKAAHQGFLGEVTWHALESFPSASMSYILKWLNKQTAEWIESSLIPPRKREAKKKGGGGGTKKTHLGYVTDKMNCLHKAIDYEWALSVPSCWRERLGRRSPVPWSCTRWRCRKRKLPSTRFCKVNSFCCHFKCRMRDKHING